MQTLTFHETVGDDGILRLQVPSLPRGEVEVVVVIQAQNNGNGQAQNPPTRSFEDFAGSLQDETFEIPAELPWETNRLPIE